MILIGTLWFAGMVAKQWSDVLSWAASWLIVLLLRDFNAGTGPQALRRQVFSCGGNMEAVCSTR